MPFWKREKSLAGPGYIVLNIIRAMNIIALLASVCASFSMLVKTFIVSKFFFFDGVSHLITAILAILLLLTELSLFKRYTTTNWPLLSPLSGFVTLGVLMIVIGVSILGNLNKAATSQSSLGTPFWRIVIASGILTCILGPVNICASYWFRNKPLGITARQVRMHGATTAALFAGANAGGQKVYIPPAGSSCYSNSPALSAKPSAATSRVAPAHHRSFHFGRRSVTLPSYQHRQQQQQQPIRNISAPINSGAGAGAGGADHRFRSSGIPVVYGSGAPTIVNMPSPTNGGGGGSGAVEYVYDEKEGYAPVVDGVQRPDLARHPALQGGKF